MECWGDKWKIFTTAAVGMMLFDSAGSLTVWHQLIRQKISQKFAL